MNKQLEVGSYVEFETGRDYGTPQVLQCLVIATEELEPMYEGDEATTLYDVAMYDDARKLGYVYRTCTVNYPSIVGLYDGVGKSERHATGAEREQVICAGLEKKLGLMRGDISSVEEGLQLVSDAEAPEHQYTVTIRETDVYQFSVQAPDRDTAEERAHQAMVDAEDKHQEFYSCTEQDTEVTGGEQEKVTIPACKDCGSTDVWSDAVARYNPETQDWDRAEANEVHFGCTDCGHDDVTIVWVDAKS